MELGNLLSRVSGFGSVFDFGKISVVISYVSSRSNKFTLIADLSVLTPVANANVTISPPTEAGGVRMVHQLEAIRAKEDSGCVSGVTVLVP
jgi:hypothetical protein